MLLATGLCGMALGFFTVRASVTQILPQHKSTRRAVLIGGVIFVATAGVLHFFIGSLADWTATLAPLLGQEETVAVIQAQFDRLMPAMVLSYVGLALLFVGSAFAVVTKKTVLPRRMLALHILVFQLVFVLIPDIRQALGAEISTWDYVLSQGSTNAAMGIWMLVNAAWAGSQLKKER